MNEPILALSGVRYGYAWGRPVLDGLDFAIRPGEVVGLLGRNGAGKTTLLSLALGLLAPARGSVRAFGLDPRTHPLRVKRRIGFVSEHDVFPPSRTLADLEAFHARIFPDWDVQLAARLRARFDVPRHTTLGALSKGQARKAALILAMAHRPELLLLDEPGGGLDASARREFVEVAVELLAEGDTAILFASHHMNDLERLAGRVALLHDHRIVLDEPLAALREGTCLAVLPRNGCDVASLRGAAGFLSVRPRGDAWHVVLREPPARASRLLVDALGRRDVRCAPLTLEDLFVELVEAEP